MAQKSNFFSKYLLNEPHDGKTIEEELKRYISILDSIVYSTADGLLVIDTSGGVEFYNEQFIKLWKIPEEIIKTKSDKKLLDFVFSQLKDPKEFLTRVNYLYSHPSEESIEELYFKDGRIFERYSRPQKIEDKIIGRVWSFRDITKRKLAEKESYLEKKKAENYLQIAGVILVAMDTNAKITMINRMGCDILGYKEEELIGKNWFKTCIPPEDYSRVFEVYNKIIAGDIKPFEYYENKVINKDGFRIDIAWHNTMLYDDNKKIIGTLSSGEDITKRKQAEKNLKQELDKTDAILHSIGDGVIATDENEKIILTNHQAEEMLGLNSEELMGKKFTQIIKLIDKDDKLVADKERPIKKVLLTGKRGSFRDYYYLRKNKTKIPIALTLAPVILDENIIGAIDVFRDITIEKQVEQAKTEFVSLASHQLRTPLSAINWYSGALLKKTKAKEKTYAEAIYTSNKRMIELVNALLNTSRLEMGTFNIEPQPTNLKEIAEEVLESLKKQIKVKNLKLIKDYDKVPEIITDPKIVRIIFQNLFSNAIKYNIEKGKIWLTLSLSGNNVVVKVTDTGYGIPEVQKNKIFTKLFRADNIRTKETEGTGLGLYLIKAMIEKIGGKIWFESKENKGSTFYVSLSVKGLQKKAGFKGFEESLY